MPTNNWSWLLPPGSKVVCLKMANQGIPWSRMVVALAALGGAFSPAAFAEFDRGRALYENHCRQCHDSWAHNYEGRAVANYSGLRERVASWSLHSGLGWNAEEIGDVTEYLNRRFYQLTK
jgi:mono/diheme cytochrome c family protein